MPSSRLALFSICSYDRFGSRSIRKVLKLCGSAEATLEASRSELLTTGMSEAVIDGFIEHRRTFEPERALETLAKDGIRVTFPSDPDFPPLLNQSSDRPEMLYVRGSWPTQPMVSIVGSRRMSEYGKLCVDRITSDLTRSGCAIVSGLALGIDGQAHEACLSAKGSTLAVLATGVSDDSLYPRQHLDLARRILDAGGCLISEAAPGTDSRKGRFPMRNRIIASLGLATVVIEASAKSGSLITAQCAMEENREVLAVPGPIWQEQAEGVNRLIKAGAKVCTSAQDVLDAIHLDQPQLIGEARAQLPLDPHERIVLDALAEPIELDRLVEQIDMPLPRLQACLSMLEMKGYAQPMSGQRWTRS